MRLLAVICVLLIALSAGAQKQDSLKMKNRVVPGNERYCILLEKGKPSVTVNGKPLTSELQLKNGNRLTASGTLIKIDGSTEVLKPGTCVNGEGKEVEQASEK